MIKSKTFVLTLVGWCCALSLLAQNFTYEGLNYRVLSDTEKTVEVASCPNASGDVVIPEFAVYNDQPYAVTTIGREAFYRCRALTSVDLGKVSTIGSGAFSECRNLISVDLKEVTTIDNWAFECCANLTSIDLKEVTSIGKRAFDGCSGLTYLDLSKVTFIGEDAFTDCTHITRLKVPVNVPTIEGSFSLDDNPIRIYPLIYVPSSSLAAYKADENWSHRVLFAYDFINQNVFYRIHSLPEQTAVYVGQLAEVSGDVVIPDSVENEGIFYKVDGIEDFAFFLNSDMTSVDLGKVTTIGIQTFDGCSGLTAVDFKEVTTLQNMAFSGCSNLSSINLENVTFIENGAFGECRLKTIKVGTTVPPVLEAEYVFSEKTYLNAMVYVPDGSKKAYQEAAYWQNFRIKEMGEMRDQPLSISSNVGGRVMVNDSVLDHPSTVMYFDETQEVCIQVIPEKDFELDSLLVNGIESGAQLVDSVLTLTMNEPKTVKVHFKRVAFHINDATDTYTDTVANTFEELTYTRNFENTEWQPLYLPFVMNYEDWQQNFEVAELNNVHQFDLDRDGDYERTELEVIRVRKGRLRANTPYLIRAKAVGEYTFTLRRVCLEAAAASSLDCSSVRYRYTFTGTYEGLSSEVVSANQFYTVGDNGELECYGSALPAFRWYLAITPRSGRVTALPKVLRIVEADDLTGIEEVAGKVTGTGDIYDLNGRKVKAEASTTEGLLPGIYILNGKKVMVK